ncbi:MAG: HEPN domain-containing protein, partial [Thermomicrobiales bacterium]
ALPGASCALASADEMGEADESGSSAHRAVGDMTTVPHPPTRPTHELLFGSLANEAMYPNFQFLALMQALETYLRREREGNYLSVEQYEPYRQRIVQSLPQGLGPDHRESLKNRIRYGYQHSLRKRIAQELNSTPYELRKYICTGDTFIKTVVNTRNYLTHYEKDEGSFILESPLDLMIAVRRLRIFLIVLLLKDIGFTEPRIIESFENDEWIMDTFHNWNAGWLH